MRLLIHLPNSITCLNLLSGYVGIVFAFHGKLKEAAFLILLACLFDFFDGFLARLLKANSPIGKDLDSLADVITFGVLPGIIIFKLSLLDYQSLPETTFHSDVPWYAYISGIVPLFSALRLAKFNIDIRQSDSFIGLPTPANALLVASLPFIFLSPSIMRVETPVFKYIPLAVGVVMAFLLISNLPLMALKFKNFTWSENKLKYILIIFSVLCIITLQMISIPFIIGSYIILSLIKPMTKSNIH